jgi:hypothetical protein
MTKRIYFEERYVLVAVKVIRKSVELLKLGTDNELAHAELLKLAAELEKSCPTKKN